MNAYAERVVGTLRRGSTDPVLVFSEPHLLTILRRYVEQYYNVARPHLRLDRNARIPRRRETTRALKVRATPVLGGLHHRYERVA